MNDLEKRLSALTPQQLGAFVRRLQAQIDEGKASGLDEHHGMTMANYVIPDGETEYHLRDGDKTLLQLFWNIPKHWKLAERACIQGVIEHKTTYYLDLKFRFELKGGDKKTRHVGNPAYVKFLETCLRNMYAICPRLVNVVALWKRQFALYQFSLVVDWPDLGNFH